MNRLKTVLFFIISMASLHVLVAQEGQTSFCGTITQPESAFGPEFVSAYDYTVYDRFGNTYFVEDWIPSEGARRSSCGVSTGYFDLLISEGFSAEEEAVICQVFHDLSQQFTSNSSQVTISIKKDPTIELPVLATGTPIVLVDGSDCGILDNVPWDKMNGDNPLFELLPDNIICGEINVIDLQPNENIFFTNLENPSAISNQQVDLYSVILHEAIHVFGMGTWINPSDGSSTENLNGTNRWDIHLFGAHQDEFILLNAGNEFCCDHHEVNLASFNFPQDINDPCLSNSWNIVFSNDEIAPVANDLSHLNEDCAGVEYYVMNGGLDEGAIKRVLHPHEKEILCRMGYTSTEYACDACILKANDDVIQITLSALNVCIAISEILENDVFPDDVSVQFIENCLDGGDYDFNYSFLDQGFLCFNDELDPGEEFSICYEIIGCDGQCSEGTIQVNREFKTLLPCADNILCSSSNLFCYGDIQGFEVGGSNYYSQLSGVSDCNVFHNSPNTPDIYEENGNNYIHFGIFPGTSSAFHKESVYVPLTKGILPGCSISIDFDHRIHPNTFDLHPSVLNVYGSAINPCDLNTTPNCANLQTPEIHCLLKDIDNSNLDWETIILTSYVNTGNEPINYLIFEIEQHPTLSFHVNLDNIIVTTDCESQATITSIVKDNCIDDGQISIEYEICIDNQSNEATLVDLNANDLLPGIDAVNNSDFTGGLSQLVFQQNQQSCQTVILELNIAPIYPSGTDINILIDLVSNNACLIDANGLSTDVTLDNCEAQPDCPCEDGYNIGETGVTTYLKNEELPFTLTGCVSFSGEIVVDRDISFWASQVKMNPGASIVIESGYTMFSTYSSFEGCEAMWKGIDIQGGVLRMIYSRVSDAHIAINTISGSEFICTNNMFEDNYYGLYARDLLISSTGIESSKFIFSGSFLPSYEGQPNLNYDFPYAGIYLSDVPFLTVSGYETTGFDSKFENLSNGIIAYRSNVVVRNVDFDKLGYDDKNISTIYGTAVYVNNCPRTVIEDCVIDNSRAGVSSFQTDVVIRDNLIFSGTNPLPFRGVEVSSNSDKSYLLMEGNEIEHNFCTAISLPLASQVDIKNNVFDVLGHGLFIHGSSPISGEDEKFSVNNNTFNMIGLPPHYPTIGFTANYNENISCSSNTFNGYASVQGDIISVENTTKSTFFNNSVNGNSANLGLFLTGCKLTSSGSNQIECNSFNGIRLGMLLENGCGNTILQGNVFENHNDGLVYSTNAVTGPQGSEALSNGNLWKGDITTDARHYGFPELSFFNVTQEELPDVVIPISGWFSDNSKESTSCFSPSDPNDPSSSLTDHDENIISEIFEEMQYGEMVQWTASYRLFDKLTKHPSLINGDFEEFYSIILYDHEIGQLYPLHEQVTVIFNTNPFNTSLLSQKTIIDFDVATVSSLMDILPLLSGNDSLNIVGQITEQLIDLDKKMIQYYETKEDSDQYLTSKFNDLKQNINEVSVNSDIGETYKAVLGCFVEYLKSTDEMDPEAMEILGQKAFLCPQIYGDAVYWARGLYDLNSSELNDWSSLDSSLCGYDVPLRIQLDNEEQERLTVFPNPVKHELQVHIALDSKESVAEIKVIDQYGKIIFLKTTSENEIAINTAPWNTGLYIVQMESNGIKESTKVVKIE